MCWENMLLMVIHWHPLDPRAHWNNSLFCKIIDNHISTFLLSSDLTSNLRLIYPIDYKEDQILQPKSLFMHWGSSIFLFSWDGSIVHWLGLNRTINKITSVISALRDKKKTLNVSETGKHILIFSRHHAGTQNPI